MIFQNILSLALGYFIGSISPAYFLGRYLKKIDIREYGTKNAGTTNVRRILGFWPAVISGLFDLLKGLLSMYVAHALGSGLLIMYLSGYMSVLGHIFPFYLRFKGGQGVGTAVGILLYLLVTLFKYGWFPFESLLVLAILTLALLYITKTGEMIGIFVLPAFLGFLYLKAPMNLTTLFMGLILLHILFINILNIFKFNILKIPVSATFELKHIRTILRPLAALFIVFYYFWDKKTILIIIGAIALIFILLDVIRLLHKGVNLFLFKSTIGLLKQKEENSFSSMTLFLVASFITVLIFEKNIAMTALLFIIFGDLFAKILGSIYGRKKFLGKTLEGFLAYFSFSLLAGYFLAHFIDIPILMLFLGALTASIVESASPLGIDDNFTVALLSASVMYITKIF